ncbi:hypothetical protein SAMN04487980_106911 [Streptomyces sp. cf124]|uniref:hypothetical protein n=1 Tax=Streptomyces sp. cf124 TaxID=1761903 RepID=UPI0008EB4159|nr:hypothetical protein [Streptomyces sp. cf124]SFO12565.1 hypothetical protein SAMN04487980_106911 [Streptomyces sp. cf124]
MTSIERTASPRFKRLITARELHVFFTPSEEERARWRPWPPLRGSRHDRRSAAGQASDRILVAEMVGLLNDAEHYAWGTEDERLAYLERRAKLLHRLVDATGDESSRYLAQDADDRATAARAGAEALADECGDVTGPSTTNVTVASHSPILSPGIRSRTRMPR